MNLPCNPSPTDQGVAGHLFMGLDDVVDNFLRPREGETHAGIGRPIVDGEPTGGSVAQGGARKYNIRDKALFLVGHLGSQHEVLGPVPDPRWFGEIQESRAHAVDEAVAGSGDSVVEEEPSFGGFNRRGSRADLDRLPPP